MLIRPMSKVALIPIPFPLEQCLFMSGTPKQLQANSLGQCIYCTWVNNSLSTVNFVPPYKQSGIYKYKCKNKKNLPLYTDAIL